MSEGTHRCGVEGCPSLAAYEVIHYSFDLEEGALVFAQDEGEHQGPGGEPNAWDASHPPGASPTYASEPAVA